CGAPMDGDECSICDYEAPEPSASSNTTTENAGASRANQTPAPTDAADATGTSLPANQPPRAAEEKTMDEELKKALAAERKRANAIRALGREHEIDAATIDALVDSDVSVEAASLQIVGKVKERRAASPHI